MTSPGNPRLRAVEAFPVEHEGQRCIALRDPAGFTDQIAVLPGPLLDLVSLFELVLLAVCVALAVVPLRSEEHTSAPVTDQSRMPSSA